MSENNPHILSLKTVRRHFRILVVDDNEINRKSVAALLQSLGYESDEVSSGHEALQAVQDVPYNLIVMDCQMPGMSGYEATEKIRKIRPGNNHIPIVALTSLNRAGDREKCLEAGMDDYLTKPAQIRELSDVLARYDVPMDEKILEDLRRVQDEVDSMLLNTVFGIFMKETPKLINDLHQSVAFLDADMLVNAAHRLKGSCAQFGAKAMQILCSRIETLGSTGRLLEAGGLIVVLEKEFDRVKTAMGKEIESFTDSAELIGDEKKRVLIVDDEADVRKVLKRFLKKIQPDTEVHEAANGFEAGHKVSTHRPRAVLLDIKMPGIDGHEVCRTIRSDPRLKDVKIVLMTGCPDENVKCTSRKYKVDGFLPKPLAIEDLDRIFKKAVF